MRKCVLFFLCLAAPAFARTVVVDQNGLKDYTNIQAAINGANNGDIIIVNPGTYTGTGNRDIDFLGKAITVRGSTGDPNNCVIDCNGTQVNPHRGFKFINGEDANSVLENLTITNGHSLYDIFGGYNEYAGGAIYCRTSSPTINNCVIANNSGASYAGGIANFVSNPRINNCTLKGNSASNGGGICNQYSDPNIINCTIINNSAVVGGGIFNDDRSNPNIADCNISNNSVLADGGGIYNQYQSSPTIIDCNISNNTASYGGGIANYSIGKLSIKNCIIKGNSVTEYGGGIYTYGGIQYIIGCSIINNSADMGGGILNSSCSDLNLKNCLINNNFASRGGGIVIFPDGDASINNCTISNNVAYSEGGGIWDEYCIADLNNCIVWGNQPNQINGNPNIRYSNIQGGYTGIGNINSNPFFSNDGFHLTGISPCIDTGDPNYISDLNDVDIDGDPRVIIRIDMGVDEVYDNESALIVITTGSFKF